MITIVEKLDSADELRNSNNLVHDENSEYLRVERDADGQVQGLSWPYNTADKGLHSMVKRRGGVWSYSAKCWRFENVSDAQAMFDEILERNPKWPVIDPTVRLYLPLIGLSIFWLQLTDERACCLFPSPISQFAYKRFL